MHTIGILGGIGPQATMDFEARLHRVAQQSVTQHGNTGYPPMVTVYMRHPPVLVDSDSIPVTPLVLDQRLLDSARRLGEWADVIVIPSNTPHLFLDPIRGASGSTIISIVDVTVEALHSRGVDAVGLVGLGIPQIYVERLAAEGLRVITASQAARDALNRAIIRLMEGADTDTDRDAAREAVEQVRSAGAPVTVLGCSEIPLLLGDAAEADDLINPAQLLAEAAVRFALK
jgi:aspartate racemase